MSEYELAWYKFSLVIKRNLDVSQRQEEIKKEWIRMSQTSTQKRKMTKKF